MKDFVYLVIGFILALMVTTLSSTTYNSHSQNAYQYDVQKVRVDGNYYIVVSSRGSVAVCPAK